MAKAKREELPLEVERSYEPDEDRMRALLRLLMKPLPKQESSDEDGS